MPPAPPAPLVPVPPTRAARRPSTAIALPAPATATSSRPRCRPAVELAARRRSTSTVSICPSPPSTSTGPFSVTSSALGLDRDGAAETPAASGGTSSSHRRRARPSAPNATISPCAVSVIVRRIAAAALRSVAARRVDRADRDRPGGAARGDRHVAAAPPVAHGSRRVVVRSPTSMLPLPVDEADVCRRVGRRTRRPARWIPRAGRERRAGLVRPTLLRVCSVERDCPSRANLRTSGVAGHDAVASPRARRSRSCPRARTRRRRTASSSSSGRAEQHLPARALGDPRNRRVGVVGAVRACRRGSRSPSGRRAACPRCPRCAPRSTDAARDEARARDLREAAVAARARRRAPRARRRSAWPRRPTR